MIRGAYLTLIGMLSCFCFGADTPVADELNPIASVAITDNLLAVDEDPPTVAPADVPDSGERATSGLDEAPTRDIKTSLFDIEVLGLRQVPDGQAVASASSRPPDDSDDEAAAAEQPSEWVVHDDYRRAMAEAAEDRKMLFIYFHEPKPNAASRAFEAETLAKFEIQEKLRRYVFLKLPRDARITVGGKSIALLDHPAFAEMRGRQGVAIIDLGHERAEYYGRVVSAFPFTRGKYYRKEALSIILDLPPGTLTQRTMIFAVRIHPERPASTQGQLNTALTEEAKQHAFYQASIQVQGHHSWDTRFQRINAKLPSGVLAQEVVAESWPNEDLVEACIDCVHSWRQSPGHWGAVRSRHPLFGYDIKRGRNGIWYATGIFGKR